MDASVTAALGGMDTGLVADATFAESSSAMSALFETVCVSTAQAVDSVLRERSDLINYKGWHGLSLLHRVCMRGDADVIAVVLRHGADPNASTDSGVGETPLHCSCRHGRMPSLATLFRGGGDPSAVDRAGHGCLHYAAQGGSISAMAYLNEVHGADYNCLSEAKQTPLHVAAIHGHWQTAAFLLRKERCPVTQKDIMGNTALHLAACYGHLSICYQLLVASRNSMALLTSVNSQNETAVDLAKQGNTARHRETHDWLSRFASKETSMKPPLYLQYLNFILPTGLCISPLVIDQMFKLTSGIKVFGYVLILAFLGWWIVRQDHRLPHPSRLPNSARAGIFILGIVGNVISYFLILKPYVVVDYLTNWTSWSALFLFILSIVSFLAKEPGRYRYETTNNADGGRDWSPVLNGIHGASFCDECELIQMEGIRHCRMCGSCFYDMQHHCLFMLRCITSSNGRHFLLLLIAVIFGCICYIFNVLLYLSLDNNFTSSVETTMTDNVNEIKGTKTTTTFWNLLTDDPFVMVVFGLDILGILWCSVLAHHQATDPRNWPVNRSGHEPRSGLSAGIFRRFHGHNCHQHHHVKVMGV